MATLGQNGKVTMLDVAKATGPGGNIEATAELLTQTNEILLDMPWYEGNSTGGHKGNVRIGLPDAIWRQMYQGVPPSKSNRAMIEDTCGMLETRAELDKDVAMLNGNTFEFRLSEATAFIESMNQQMAAALFYGNTAVNPERFMGLQPRYNALTGAANSQNIISAAGAGADNTSVWLVVWGKETVFGIYPKGSKGGLIHEDLGIIDAFDGNTPAGRYRAYADHWQWKCGLHVRDWRYIVRICNIDISDLVGQTGTQASTASTQLMKLMIRTQARVPKMAMGKAVFYAPRVIKEMIAIQALDKSNNAVKIVEATTQFGGVTPGWVDKETQFFGTPVRTCDQILTTETVVS